MELGTGNAACTVWFVAGDTVRVLGAAAGCHAAEDDRSAATLRAKQNRLQCGSTLTNLHFLGADHDSDAKNARRVASTAAAP